MKVNEIIKGKIQGLKSIGYSGAVIKKKLLNENNIKISVRQINKIYRNSIQPGEEKKKQGRPSIFTNEDIEKIKKAITNNRKLTAVSIQRNMRLNPNHASVRTIQNLLNKIGYHARVAPSKPKLSDKNISDRYEFAMEIDEWQQEDIDQIIFTDESKMYCHKSGKVFLRCKRGYQIPSRLFEDKTLYHGGKEILVWGAISSFGSVSLQRIEGTLNSEKYEQVLNNGLFENPNVDLEDKILQQDNCGPHRSKAIKEFLKGKIDLLQWPSKSPDLNIIESVWGFCKDFLYQKQNKIQSKEDVWKWCQRAFFSDECHDLIQKLYQNYSNRIEAVLQKEGKNTRY